ncbi:MAG: triple tyrosine motif-containing protein, partial [Flammeovirgaceae bacterium]
IYFTDKKGVLEFDGKNWQITPTPGAVYTVAVLDNEVYAGGVFGFGKLAVTMGAAKRYVPMSDQAHIFSSVASGGKLYACNDRSLFVFAGGKQLNEIRAARDELFSGLFEMNGVVFLKTGQRQLRQVTTQDALTPPVTLPVDSDIILSSGTNSDGFALIGTEKGLLYYLKDPQKPLQELRLEDQAYVSQHRLVDAVWINKNAIAIGTLLGGVMIVNPSTGKTIDVIDYNHGLPDNEVFAMLADHDEGVWVAHHYGFSRIAPSIPFKSYNHYPGLQGNLLCVKSVNGQLYVGTTVGLFKLVREDRPPLPVPAVAAIGNADQPRARGLFNFLRRRKPKNVSVTPVQPQKKLPVPAVEARQARYAYKKIESIVGKVTHLLTASNKLVASGLGGVFEVVDLKAKPITTEAVRSTFFSAHLQQLLVCTYNDEMKSYGFANGWRSTGLLDTLRDYVSYAFEDNYENVWLCGRSNIYKLETLDGVVSDVSTMGINNPSLDEMVGVAYGSDVYVAASGEFKRFNSTTNTFVKYDSLPGSHRYFASAGYFWFNNGTQWRTVDKKLRGVKLQWLSLFPNLRYLTPDEKAESLWVITANNELYKFLAFAQPQQEHHHPLMLRNILGQQFKLESDKRMVLNQPDNVLSFEFIQPEYVSRNAVQYRYQVKGLTNGWTAWSNSNHIANFPFLPAGTYQLLMQSRDLLGNESKVETISFEVLPPYWKRWWFYALEFVFFSLLVAVSARAGSSNTRYRWVSE